MHDVTTRRLLVVDEHGTPRIALTASAADGARIALLDADGFEHLTLVSTPDRAAVTLTARTPDTDPTRVELFALDPEPPDDPPSPAPDDHPYVGLELIDTGTTVAGFSLYQSHPPHPWTTPR